MCPPPPYCAKLWTKEEQGRANGLGWTWTMDGRSKRLKDHCGHDPCGQLVSMWSVLPPTQQLVIAGQVTSICPLVSLTQQAYKLWRILYVDSIHINVHFHVFECVKICVFLLPSCYVYVTFFLYVFAVFPLILTDMVWPSSSLQAGAQSLQRPSRYCFWTGPNKQTIKREEDVSDWIASWWCSI